MNRSSIGEIDVHGIAKTAGPAPGIKAGIVKIILIIRKDLRVEIEGKTVLKGFAGILDQVNPKIDIISVFIPGAIGEFHVTQFCVELNVHFPVDSGCIIIGIVSQKKGEVIISIVFPILVMDVGGG
jgi:hypothetical protein